MALGVELCAKRSERRGVGKVLREAGVLAQRLIDALELPIDGTLDLHTFSPRDLRTLILDYLGECLERGIFELRIIHGKGQGVLRRTVHSLLQRDPRVAAFQLADESGGGWGATRRA